ncbi:MAG: TIGR03016 family PEP-CTERM system-associated outer membrane protein [Burkholderiaceae bacterium]
MGLEKHQDTDNTAMDMGTARRHSAIGLIGIAISAYGVSSFAQTATPWQTLDLLGLRYLNIPKADPRSGIATALGVRGGVTYSDNLNLGPKGKEVSGTILEISPYFYATADRPKLQGMLYYSLRNFYNTESSDRQAARHELQAMGRSQLGDSNFWLAGRASVFDINSSPFFTSSFDPSTSSNNRSRYQRYDFTPYYVGGTPDTQYMLMYGITYVDINQGSHVTRNTGLGRIRSSLEGRGLGWNAMARTQQYDYQFGYSYHRNDAQFGLQYEFSSTLMGGITANYANSDRLRSTSGKTSGWGPGAYMAWRPTEHTSLSAVTIQNYYGNTTRLRISERASSWIFGASYDRSVVDYSQGIVLSYDPSLVTGGPGNDQYDPGSNATTGQPEAGGNNQQNGVPTDYGAALAGGVVAAPLIWMRTAQATVGLIRPRDSFTLTLFEMNRHAAPIEGEAPVIGSGGLYDLEQRGITARFQHKLTPVSTFNLVSRAVRSETQTNSSRSTLIQHMVYYNQRLNQQLSVGIGYRRSRQIANGDSLARYTENALLLGADYRF